MKKIKCTHCNKKIKSILPIKCKCKNYYCNIHKISTDHYCKFNYLKENKENLQKINIQVKCSKIKNRI